MNTFQANEVYNQVFRIPVGTPVPANSKFLDDTLRSCPELAEFFSTEADFEDYLKTQKPYSLESSLPYTQNNLDHPDIKVMYNGRATPVCEGWIFVSCLRYARANPLTLVNFDYCQSQIITPQVALATLKYLAQPRFLNNMSKWFKTTEFWLQGLKLCPWAFFFLHYDQRNDLDLAALAICRQPDMIMFGESRVRSDRSTAIEAVSRDGLLLEYLSMDLRGDLEIVKRACKENLGAAKFISRNLLLDRALLQGLQKHGVYMKDLHEHAQTDPEIIENYKQCGITDGWPSTPRSSTWGYHPSNGPCASQIKYSLEKDYQPRVYPEVTWMWPAKANRF